MSRFSRFEHDQTVSIDELTRTILFDETLAFDDIWSPPTARAEALRIFGIKFSAVLNSARFSKGVPELLDSLNHTTAKEIVWGIRRAKVLMAIAFIDAEADKIIGAACWDYPKRNDKNLIVACS